MTDKDARSSSGTTAIVIVAAVLILGIPCIAGVVAVFGVGFFFVRSGATAPDQPQMEVMGQPVETMVSPPPAESAPEPIAPMPPETAAPSETTVPAPPDGK